MAKKDPPKPPPLTPEQSKLLDASVAAEAGAEGHPTPDVEKPYVPVGNLEERVRKLESIVEAGMVERLAPPARGEQRGVFDSRKGVPMPAPGWREPAAAAPNDPEQIEVVRVWEDPSGEMKELERLRVVVLGSETDHVVVDWPNGAGAQKFSRETGEAEAPSLRSYRLAEPYHEDDVFGPDDD